jgi:4-hydroxy-tetrahydrodipicolinate reductase
MKIGILGCAGRMGQSLVRQVTSTPGCVLAAACDRPGFAGIERDVGTVAGLEPLGVAVADGAAAVFAACDVVIDFTSPAATLDHVALAVAHRCHLVIGTTGLSAAAETALAEAAAHVVIVASPNMSLGVNILAGLVKRVAQTLDPSFDIEILEMHHRAKVDAPSGTALALGRAAAEGRGVALEQAAVRVRDGHTGPRGAGDIGFAVLRGGDVIGDHVVMFAGQGERIELAHRASNRDIYARGAVAAARWTRGQVPGLYGMADVLGM